MKVLLVNSRYAPYSTGGADISTRKLAEALAKRGNYVDVLTCNDIDTTDRLNEVIVHRKKFHNVCTYFDLKKKNKFIKYIYKFIDIYNLFNYRDIKEIVNSINPDVIHTNNINGISPIIWRIARKAQIPVVHTCRDYFLMCPRTTLVKKTKKKCKTPRLICKLWRKCYISNARSINVVTAPSRYTLDVHVANGYFKYAKKITIYNAIDFNIEKTKNILRNRKTKKSNIFKIIYLGAIEQHKGVDFLLEELKSFKMGNIEIYFAGKGSLVKKVKASAESDKRIHYLGFLDENQLDSILCDMDLLICPSLWPEPFGRVIIDAYKYALPVIGSNLGGIPELIRDTGILISPGNGAELRQAIEIMVFDREKYISFCEATINMLQDFAVETQAVLFENVYAETIKK